MKTKLLSLFTLVCVVNTMDAQVLYSEDFDNLTLGNVGTDYTGKTAGQGGWYTLSDSFEIPSENDNSYFKIVSEPGRGKVLELGTTPGKGQTYLQKRDIDTYWSKRSVGNDILKIEFDFYTGDEFDDGKTGLPVQGAIFAMKSNEIFTAPSNDVISLFGYRPDEKYLTFYAASKNCYKASPPPHPYTYSDKMWINVIYYLDFKNQKILFLIPSNNLFCECFLDQNTDITSLLLKNSNNIGSQAIIPKYKYDNFVISAVDKVPLNVQDFISSKFNLYPNPSNDIVNITNNENIRVEKIDVFDISGKLVQSKTFNKEAEIQLNISDLASGTYMFHISTTEGNAVKKVVKK